MLGSCCACAKGAAANTAVTRTARRALPLELGIRKHDQKTPPDEERSTGSARERHGLFRFGAFQAARIRRPSIQYTREWYRPQARIAGHLTFHAVVRFRPHREPGSALQRGV